MVMYKQNQGLVAGGTIGPQSSGGMMSPQKKPATYSVQSMGDFFNIRNIPFLSNIANTVQRFTDPYGYNANQAAKNQEAQQLRNTFQSTAQQSVAPPMPTQRPLMAPPSAPVAQAAAPIKPAPRVGATYSLPTNVTDIGPVSQEPTVTAGYRPPLRSAAADIQNPFTPEMQALMESKAIEQAEQQAAVTAQRLNAQLAGTGLMSGGPSGLSASMARQVASATEANRLNALREIGLQVPQMRADFDLRRAGVVDPYNISASAEGRAFARQPLELGGMERQNVLLDKQGRQLDIQNSLNQLELDIKGDPEVLKSTIQALIDGNHLKGAELEAAKILLEENDPKAWWNNQAYKAGKEGILTVLKGFAEGAGRGLASK
jgi:hypothetical protein